jgi:hypothetical protein
MTPTLPTALAHSKLNSRTGVEALLTRIRDARSAELIGNLLTPLFPLACPWKSESELPTQLAQEHKKTLKEFTMVAWEYGQTWTQSAKGIRGWLDATDDDVRAYALRCAKVRFPGNQKLAWAVRVTGRAIPGKTHEIQWARINDARFWRRAIRVRILREREHFYLRLKLLGRSQETYVSDRQLETRSRQLRQQAQWMKDTVLVPRFLLPGESSTGLLTLEQVASTLQTRFAKLYAFVKAMDEIAQAEGLESGMLTLTLEPEWHPNPSHGTGSWNGASPREAHRSMTQRWQAFLRDLDRAKVGVSGLRVVEPHKDSCPHWHVWLLYKPEAETIILSTIMRYFPNKLKIRSPSNKGDKPHANDRMYETRADLLISNGQQLKHDKEGAQVEFSRIDRNISSGASYIMKYLLKTVDAGETLNAEVGLFADTVTAKEDKARKEKHDAAAKRVDAYRSLWGINAAQFFGVAKCLSAWDELRRLTKPPIDSRLQKLWILARGTDKPGRIAKNAGIRGNPRAFIEALGGLAACGKPPKDEVRQSIGRLTEAKTNGYGEEIHHAKGVILVERRQQKVRKGQINQETGEVYARSGWRSVRTVVASVVTRLGEWVMVSPSRSKALDADFLVAQRKAAKAAFDRTGLTADKWPAFLKDRAQKIEPVMKDLLPGTHKQAALRAQERAHQRDAAQTPTGLGKLAQQHFWSSLWAAWETLCPDERYPQVA